MLNPEFMSVWFRKIVGKLLFDHPVTFPELAVHVHVNVVPATFEVRLMFVGELLHNCLFRGVLEISACGCTVTI